MPRKYIKLEHVRDKAVRIVEQSHRYGDFGDPYERWQSTNGLSLSSCSCPEARLREDIVFMRGTNTDEDDDILHFNSWEDYFRFTFAVNEYNWVHR